LYSFLPLPVLRSPLLPIAPAAIVIIAGKYRTGKSFLMNQLSGLASGFSVGHTVESHTRGIWIGSSGVVGRTAEGEEVDIVFMDSEGLGATEKVRRAAARPSPPTSPTLLTRQAAAPSRRAEPTP
jgi:Guanylate-binding protein, N-terminal domain